MPDIEILLVDDDEGHVELVRRNLKRAGIQNVIATFATGDDAIDYLFGVPGRPGRADVRELLVLLDINLPGRSDGIEVLRRIKMDPMTRKIPVMMLTTTDNPREINRCYDLGCNVYVVKPVASDQFVEAVRRLGLFISIVSTPRASSGAT